MLKLVGPEPPKGAADPRLYEGLDGLLSPLSLRSLMGTLAFSRGKVTRDSLVCLGIAFGEPLEQTEEAITGAIADGKIAIGDDNVVSPGIRNEQRIRSHARARTHSSPIWDGTWVRVAFPDGLDHPGVPDSVRNLLKADRLGELRPGIWLRPDNLGTMAKLSDAASPSQAYLPSITRVERPRHKASLLWPLEEFSRRSIILADATESFCEQTTIDPDSHVPQGWILMIALMTQIGFDPLLPPALLPAPWGGDRSQTARRVVSKHMRSSVTSQLLIDFSD